MLNGCPVLEKYNALIAARPLAAAQISYCERCRNRGAWKEQIDATHARQVICACGAWFAPGVLPFRTAAPFSEKKP